MSIKFDPRGQTGNTVMSILEAPYLIEAHPNGSADYDKIEAPIQNKTQKYVQAQHAVLKITIAA